MKRIYQILNLKTSRFIQVLVLLSTFSPFSLWSQTFPIDANTVLVPPYTLNLSDYQVEKSQDLMVNITLNDPVEPFWDVRFRVTVSNNGTDILQTSPAFQPEPYRLNQFSTVMLTGFELSEYLSLNNLVGINGFTNRGTLPEGLNSICIEVLDYNRQDIVLSRKACGSGYAILNDPPFTQLPICEEDLPFQEAQNIVFTWLPMHLGSPNPVTNIEYKFSIVRVEEGYNQFEAMEAAAPIYQETTTTTTVVLQDPILEPGFTYAWQVQVVDPGIFDANGDLASKEGFKNQGYSVVCSFNYLEPEVDLSELYTESAEAQCGASCQGEIPSNSEIITDLSTGDVVQVGKFFMNITELTSSSGGFYSGNGYIFIPFLLSNMNVTFEDLTVNTDMVMFSGDVVTDIDSDLLDANYADIDGEMVVSGDEIVAIDEYVKSEGRRVSEVERGSSLGLPIALDNTIGGVTQDLIITGISFEKDIAYLNAVMTFGTQDGGDHIAFGAKGICFHPFGVGGGTAELSLYEDFSLGDYSDFDLTFKAPGDGNDGTYLTFDCTGFQELNVQGEYEFASDMLVAADGSGEPVTATFSFTTYEWGEFITELEMDPFEVYDVEGYVFTLQNAYLDFSDVANPEDISFPDDYEDTGDDWKGFYLSTLSLTLPEDLSQVSGDISMGVQDLIIDHSGVSGSVFAAEILQIDDGRLGEWAFSIDTVQINFVSNTLTEGNLLGQIHVPILDEDNSLNYGAAMTKSDEGIDLLFNIQTEEDVSASMWAAEMSLYNSSVIAIEKTSDGFVPYAELHGGLTVDVEIQEGNAFQVEAMAFEGLKINHPDETKRLAVDAFTLFGGGPGFEEDDSDEEEEEDGEQESLSGFPISFSNVGFVEGDGNEAGINFDLNLNLTGDDLGVGATGNLTLTGEYNASGAPFNAWKFKGVELSTLEVSADLAAGSIEGSLEIYKGDAEYGSGFKGMLTAEFRAIGQVDALAQFGKVDGYRYFFVDAMLLSQTPFVDVLGVGLYGFGGGMWHHMSREERNPAMDLEAGSVFAEPSELGASLSGIVYTPDNESLLGLKAALTMGIAPGTGFSADVSLEATFGMSNNAPSIRNIAFGGKAYMMSPGTILDREDSKVVGQFDADLNLTDPDDPVFIGVAQIAVNLAVINGSGQASIKLSSDESYLWLGTPTNRVNVNVLNLASLGMYADIGDIVPPMPSIRDLVPNFDGNLESQRPASLDGTKIIFGAKFDMPEKSYTVGPFFASAYFGMGFDAYLRQVSSSGCGIANGNIGFDNWYLSGQAYAYGGGNIGLKVRTFFYKGNVNLIDLAASIVMQAELPNPSWLKGDVNVEYRILSGAIKGKVKFKFEVGERCEFSENAMAGVEIIADISPENNERNVSCLASPTIATNFALNRNVKVEQLNSSGDLDTYFYQPYVSSFTMDQGASYNRKIASDGNTASLALRELLKPYTNYSVTATVKWKKRKEGRSNWEILDGEESKTISFRTGQLPDFIPEEAVAISFPFRDGRNVYDRPANKPFEVYMKMGGWSYLFDDDADFDYKLKIEDLTGGGSRETTVTYLEERAGFITVALLIGGSSSWNNWINGRDGNIFKVSVVGEYKRASSVSVSTNRTSEEEGVEVRERELSGTNESDIEDKRIYEWYFRKSDYNAPNNKLADYKFVHERSWGENYNGYDTRRHEVLGRLNSSERFDAIDFEGYSFSIGGLDLHWPSVFYLHRIDYDNSTFSKVKSIMDRYNHIRNTAHGLSGSRSNYYYHRGRNRDRWRGHRDAQLSWNRWDVWAGAKGLNWISRHWNRDWLTDAEKSSGSPGNGWRIYSNSNIRFNTRAERWVADVHRNIQVHANNYTKQGYRFNRGGYVYKSWNASGELKNSTWGIGWRHPEKDDSGIYWLRLNR